MKKDVADAWVKDLRESGAKQTPVKLFDGEGYCCLGRLCIVLGYKFEQVSDFTYIIQDGSGYFQDALLIPSIVEKAGMANRSGAVSTEIYGRYPINFDLTELNDHCNFNFSQIADMIEHFWEDL